MSAKYAPLCLAAVDTITPQGYRSFVVAKSTARDWRLECKGGHTAIRAVFLCLQHGPIMSGPCGALRGAGPFARYANPHGSAHQIGVGGGSFQAKELSMNAISPKRYRAVSIHTKTTHTVIAHSFAGAAALLPADAAIICRTPVTRQIAQEVAA